MAKSAHNDVLDALLNYVKNNATRVAVCSTEPTTYTELITTYKLAIKTISGTDFTGPEDDTSGRKLTSVQHSAITVDTGGSAQHVGYGDSSNSKLLYVTTCTSQTLTGGNTVTIPAWKINVQDPT